jgi:hypothetical protein
MPTYLLNELKSLWQTKLHKDCPEYHQQDKDSIFNWLLQEDLERFDRLTLKELALINQQINYRWRILRQRYLKIEPALAYHRLMLRLCSLIIHCCSVPHLVATNRSFQWSLVDAIESVIQEILNSDRYIQYQIRLITRCTHDPRLREALSLATLEEYCLRSIHNQPLVYYHFISFLNAQGLNQDERKKLSCFKAILKEQAIVNWEKQQLECLQVQRKLESYLAENVSFLAVRWLRLYLLGNSQNTIAKTLNISVKQVQQLQEKVKDNARQVLCLVYNTEEN